jgi:hypothetical protein
MGVPCVVVVAWRGGGVCGACGERVCGGGSESKGGPRCTPRALHASCGCDGRFRAYGSDLLPVARTSCPPGTL